MYREKIKKFIEENREGALKLWGDIVNIDSGSPDKEGVDKVIDVVKVAMDEAGFETKVYEMEKAGNTIVGTFNGESIEAPIIFIGHVDTVFNDNDTKERPFRIEDGKAYGPGVLDMKAGVVIGIYVAKALKEAGYSKRPIKMVYVGDEEVAHEHSNATEVLKEESMGALAALNFETGRLNNNVVVGRKGSRMFKVRIDGVSVHSGNEPEKGRSAILEASHKIIELEALNDIHRGKLINVGTIKGGTSDNTVPGFCEFGVATRHINNEIGDEIVKDVTEVLEKQFVKDTVTTFQSGLGLDCMEKTEGVMELFELINKVGLELGLEPLNAVEVGGGSDSATTVSIGVPTVCGLGAKGEFQHTKDEYAVVETLFERMELAANVVVELD